MQTTSYRLQSQIEHLTPASQHEWFRNYLKDILESDNPYYVKSDYIALSFLELDNKIDYLTKEIRQLTQLKQKLQQAKTIGLEIAAQTLREYGIDKMEGAAISSLTITPPKTKTKEVIRIKDPQKVMELGFVKLSVDEKALKEALHHTEMFTQLDRYVDVSIEKEEVPARLKINKRRHTDTSHADMIEMSSVA